MLDPAILGAAEAQWGRPREVFVRQEILPWEMDLIQRICGDTRSHDLTIFISRGNELALIHKPDDPDGAFWAPGGGLDPGEDMETAARREAREETGLEVEVTRYLLRLNAVFFTADRQRKWISHVFAARYLSGDPVPLDKKEVEMAEWVSIERFHREVSPILHASGWGRYRYRLYLAELAFAELGLTVGVEGGAAEPPHSPRGHAA